jgi:hypothetical protein
LKDDGGKVGGGIDTSEVQSFQIVVDKPHVWHNAANRYEVILDADVNATDVLAIIDFINAKGSGPVTSQSQQGPPYLDVTADNYVAADDVLRVINHINAQNPRLAQLFAAAEQELVNSKDADLNGLIDLMLTEREGSAAKRRAQ